MRAFSLLTLWVVLGSLLGAAWVESASGSSTDAPKETAVKVEKKIERGVEAAAKGVERGITAAKSGIEHGAKTAADGVQRGAAAAARGVERGAKATARAANTVAKKVEASQAAK